MASFCWQLRALMGKNMNILKRNCCTTIVELIFPIFLMIILVCLRQAFKGEEKYFTKEEKNDSNYFLERSSAYVDDTELTNLKTTFFASSDYTAQNATKDSIGEAYNSTKYFMWKNNIFKVRPIFGICNKFQDSKDDIRKIVFFLGSEKEALKTLFSNLYDIYEKDYTIKLGFDTLKFDTQFNSYSDVKSYLDQKNYDKDDSIDKICMGMTLDKKSDGSYDFRLHYFDLGYNSKGSLDVPSAMGDYYNVFQQGPDLASYETYKYDGFNFIYKKVYEYIYQQAGLNVKVNFALMAQKYHDYTSDVFSQFVGYVVPSFTMIAYLSPLCIYVFRMVSEKESRAKEGMKIMGMGEGVYFLSYFIQFFLFNLFHSICNGIVIHIMFEHIPFIWLFLVYLLFGLNIFSMAFLFQSFIDKTRVALILSILIYYVTSFIYIAIYDENVPTATKVGCSIFPTVAIEVGLIVFAKFQAGLKDLHASDINKKYMNFYARDMYIMFTVDFFLYLFIGYYLQNIISHDFGISKPFYFLCTKGYWCKQKKKLTEEELQKIKEEQDNELKNGLYGKNKNYESEEIYNTRDQDQVLKIRKLVKVFGDNKRAVDGLDLNLYKDEIFALLGHNGSGKTTTISMLSGLYDATEGHCLFGGENILDDESMENFRSILGICPQHDVLFDDLTVEEHLYMFCNFKGFQSDLVNEEVQKTMRDFRISDIANIIAKNLSAGQRRKLSIAISIIGGSKVIFLDEPSSGMDITSRRNLWEILKRICDDKIIVLTTHYMEEASVLGKRIGIIADGKLRCLGTPLYLIERFGKFMSVNITKEKDCDDDKIIEFFKQKSPNVEYEKLSEEILFRIPKNGGEDNEDEDEDNEDNAEKLPLSDNSNKDGSENEDKKAKKKKKETKPKNTKKSSGPELSYKDFFNDLDSKKSELKIKSYTASMPTLEDVFLNVASSDLQKVDGKQQKFNNVGSENDKILFEDNNFGDYSPSTKFTLDLGISLKKRAFQVIRDVKTFILELLCPVVLVLLGLCVCKVNFVDDSDPFVPNLDNVFDVNYVYFGGNTGVNYNDLATDVGNTKVTSFKNGGSLLPQTAMDFYTRVFKEDNEENYAGYFFFNIDTTSTTKTFEFFQLLNTTFKMGNSFYTPYIFDKITKKLNTDNSKDIKVTFTQQNLPLSQDVVDQMNESKNNMLALFTCIAFSLIPANFVTIIVKERVNNSKHLMKVSGITLTSYWLSNYIFELMKYYVEGGVILLIIYLFDYFPDYFWLLYILYGPSMVSFTYLVSFFFENESGAQNGLILLNLLFGALCTTICLSLRMNDSTATVGKALCYIFRLLPSFSIGFGFSMLLNATAFMYLEMSLSDYLKAKSSTILKPQFVGADLIYMAIETVVYLLILILIEKRTYGSRQIDDEQIVFKECPDENVNEEIKRAQNGLLTIKEDNSDPTPKRAIEPAGDNTEKALNDKVVELPSSKVLKNNSNPESPEGSENAKKRKDNEEIKDYAVRIKNLKKIYEKCGCCGFVPIKEAVKDISFCVEYGECFGMLGLNGAGKTSIFKAITQEHHQTHGGIYIDGVDTSQRFDDIHDMFGYCPQYDAIFEYMTVYENLEFYARIKGIALDKLDKMICAFIDEMSLSQYKNKIAGNLSGGNKRKLSVAISMIANPPIILLDEPSTGMDPEARRFMWAIIHKISTKRKKSAVIMTTHAMDEAETLCRRMAIMVNGEFVCLGTSQEIKDKYGYGYEIDVRIKPFNNEILNKMIEGIDDPNVVINLNNVQEILTKIHKESYYDELKPDRIGRKLLKEMESVGKINLFILCSWIHYVNCALKSIKDILESFNEIILTEFIENNFLFKIKKDENSKSIGYLFGLIETKKDDCNITEYSIQPTSLEQIFNQFAAQQDANAVDNEDKNKFEDGDNQVPQDDINTKVEIPINKDVIGKLVY